MTGIAREDGVALLVAMMALLLLTALGSALLLTSSSETMIAAHFRDNLEARYAAGVAIARASGEAAPIGDWASIAGGVLPSVWVDGPPTGVRTLADGSMIDMGQALNMANCAKATACSTADIEAVSADRPWGPNNPRWTPYAYGPLRDVLPSPAVVDTPYYVLLLLAAAPIGVPGWDVLALRSEAFGPRGAHAVIEAVLGRPNSDSGDETGYNLPVGQSTVRILSWREVR